MFIRKKTYAPFPTIWHLRICMTYDLLTWISIRIIYTSRVIYLQNLKRSWIIHYTRCESPTWPLTYSYDRMNLILLAIFNSWRNIHLRSLKLLGQTGLAIRWRQILHLTLTNPTSIVVICLPTKLEALGTENYPLKKFWEPDITFDLDIVQTDLNSNRDHWITNNYFPTEFKMSGQSIFDLSVAQCVGRPTCYLTLTFDLLTGISFINWGQKNAYFILNDLGPINFC